MESFWPTYSSQSYPNFTSCVRHRFGRVTWRDGLADPTHNLCPSAPLISRLNALFPHAGGSKTCSNGIPGIESSDGLACCPSECDSCDVCSSRRLNYDSSSDDSGSGCGGRRRLTVRGSDSSKSRDLTENYCGVLSRRRLTNYDSSDSKDSGGYEDYCECGSGSSGYRRLRGLTYDSSDSGDSCNCGAGRRLTYYYGGGGDSSDSGDGNDDCNCECECECECTPEVPEVPEPVCCASESCDVTGSAPCFFGKCFGARPH